MYFWTRLRTRLLLLAVLAILPALIVFLVDTDIERHKALSHAEDQVLAFARLKAGYYAEFAAQVHVMLETIAAIPDVADARQPDCKTTFVRILAHDKRFNNLGVVGSNGRLLCSGLPDNGAMNVPRRNAVRQAFATREFAVGGYAIGQVSDLPEITFAYPMLDPRRGSVTAVAYAAVNMQWLSEVDGSALLPADNSFYLIDGKDRVLVARPDGGTVRGSTLGFAHRAAWQGNDEAATFMGRDSQGRTSLYARVRMHGGHNESDLYAVVGLPADIIFGPPDKLLYHNLVLFTVLTGLFLLIAWFGSDVLILRHFHALLQGARRIRSGDYASRAAVRGSGEFAELAMEFDSMAQSLQRRREEAQAYIAHINRLSRLYRVISSINGVILRVRDRRELLRETCRVAVEVGNFRFAWAGTVDVENDEVKPLAHAGSGATYLESLRLSTRGDRVEGRGGVGQAVRAGTFAVTNDIDGDPAMQFWRQAAHDHDYRSAGAFVLKVTDRVVGVLAVYSAEQNFFDEDETRLMAEVAADTSHGLEHIANSERAEFLANFDPLTDLPNKSYFLTRLDNAISRAQRSGQIVAAVVMRIAELDRINGTLGYAAGDDVVKQTGRMVTSNMRYGDTLARIGGQTFGVIMENITAHEDMPALIARMLQDFPKTMHSENQEVMIHLNAGIAVFPFDASNGAGLYRQAELVLHATADDLGTPYRFYSHDIDRRAAERYAIDAALTHALERNEMRLYYQPIVDISTRRTVSMEALLRWNSAQLGAVSPTTFIPVAEENGGIVTLGYWAMEEACRQIHVWQAGPRRAVPVSVNVSMRQLREADFGDRVKTIFSTCPQHTEPLLNIEITESQLMGTPRQVAWLLTELRALGIRLAIDDFGTGYSSLSYLNQLPADTLKIDRSFVLYLGKDAAAETVVRGVIGLAHSLGLTVVAEGVETEAQLGLLKKFGCDYAQGYLFSPPVPGDQAEAFLPAR